MKQGKNPTRQEKKILTARKLNAGDWLVCKHTSTEMVISHKHCDKIRTIALGVKE